MVDLKLSLYTKTWTWMNWMAIALMSIGIYVLFVWFGDMLTFFNSYKTAKMTITSVQSYLCVAFFSIIVYMFDMALLIARKEMCTSLGTFFKSIVRRKKEEDSIIFKKVVKLYKDQSRMEEIQRAAERETTRNLKD